MCACNVTLVERFEQNSIYYYIYIILKDNTTIGVNKLQNMSSLSLEGLGSLERKEDLKTYISPLMQFLHSTTAVQHSTTAVHLNTTAVQHSRPTTGFLMAPAGQRTVVVSTGTHQLLYFYDSVGLKSLRTLLSDLMYSLGLCVRVRDVSVNT